jgi:type I restriction enzyme, S subunit
LKNRNENRPGYKKTKVGWIPEQWRCLSLCNAGIAVIDGDRGKEYPKQHEFSKDGDCLFLSAANVTKKGFFFGECQFISEKKIRNYEKGSFKKET